MTKNDTAETALYQTTGSHKMPFSELLEYCENIGLYSLSVHDSTGTGLAFSTETATLTSAVTTEAQLIEALDQGVVATLDETNGEPVLWAVWACE